MWRRTIRTTSSPNASTLGLGPAWQPDHVSRRRSPHRCRSWVCQIFCVSGRDGVHRMWSASRTASAAAGAGAAAAAPVSTVSEEIVDYIRQSFRPGQNVLPGGVAGALEFELDYGVKLSKAGHYLKAVDRLPQVEKMLADAKISGSAQQMGAQPPTQATTSAGTVSPGSTPEREGPPPEPWTVGWPYATQQASVSPCAARKVARRC